MGIFKFLNKSTEKAVSDNNNTGPSETEFKTKIGRDLWRQLFFFCNFSYVKKLLNCTLLSENFGTFYQTENFQYVFLKVVLIWFRALECKKCGKETVQVTSELGTSLTYCQNKFCEFFGKQTNL